MTSDAGGAPAERSTALRAILAAGLLAGVLDISAAFAVWAVRGVGPVRILQSVASGLLGASAYSGGAGTAVLGGLLHFFIATVAAAVYYETSLKIGLLTRAPLLSGALYGVGVYAFMNHVVLPLSAVPKRPFALGMALVMVVIHIFCVGLPIALVVRRCSSKA